MNIIRDENDGNTALHRASVGKKSLKCTSLLLEAGAKLKTNAIGLTPKIEDFFTKENDDQITSALVDGLVERVKADQLDQEKALRLLIPDNDDSDGNASMYNASVYDASVYDASVYDASVYDASLYNSSVYDSSVYNVSVNDVFIFDTSMNDVSDSRVVTGYLGGWVTWSEGHEVHI